MENLVVMFGLNPSMTANIAKQVADRLDLYYLSINDLIEYEFSKVVFDYENCGQEYFQSKVLKLVKSVFDYENTIAVVDVDNLFSDEVITIAKSKSKLIFLNFNNGESMPIVNNIVFDEMQAICLQYADFVVDEADNDIMIEQILKYLNIK